MIEKMSESHIKDIQQIDNEAFNSSFSRTLGCIKSYITEGKDTGLVYKVDGKVEGYLFNHIWGNFAWFGPLGVDPHYKKSGIGKELVKETIKNLTSCSTIKTLMLCTMPESPYNIGFYSRLGFIPLTLTFMMMKESAYFQEVHQNEMDYSAEIIDNTINIQGSPLARDVKRISNELLQGLDLTPQLNIIEDYKYGKIVILKHKSKTKGFAICYTKSLRETKAEYLDIKLLCIADVDDYTTALDVLLSKCAQVACHHNLTNILISCDSRDTATYMHLTQKHKFTISKSFLNMVYSSNLADTDKISDSTGGLNVNGILLCRFAG